MIDENLKCVIAVIVITGRLDYLYTINIQYGYLGRFNVSVVFPWCINQSVINDLLAPKPGVIEHLTKLPVMKKMKSDCQS